MRFAFWRRKPMFTAAEMAAMAVRFARHEEGQWLATA